MECLRLMARRGNRFDAAVQNFHHHYLMVWELIRLRLHHFLWALGTGHHWL